MPKRLLISETGVSVSEYRRVTSRSCWSVSLRRVPAVPSLLEVSPSEPDPDAVDRDVSVVSMNLSNLSSESYSMRCTTATPDVKKINLLRRWSGRSMDMSGSDGRLVRTAARHVSKTEA
jgi:hypothetical protein